MIRRSEVGQRNGAQVPTEGGSFTLWRRPGLPRTNPSGGPQRHPNLGPWGRKTWMYYKKPKSMLPWRVREELCLETSWKQLRLEGHVLWPWKKRPWECVLAHSKGVCISLSERKLSQTKCLFLKFSLNEMKSSFLSLRSDFVRAIYIFSALTGQSFKVII